MSADKRNFDEKGAASSAAPDSSHVEQDDDMKKDKSKDKNKEPVELTEEESTEESVDDKLAAAYEEVAAVNDRYARLQAEWDNFRKRTSVERELERERATERLVEQLLPVIDDFERALKHAEEVEKDEAFSSFVQGVKAVHGKLVGALRRVGVEVVNPKDELFDMNLHQAVSQVEDGSVYEETVAQVLQPGYVLGGKVIRPAMVITTTGGEPRPKEEDTE